MELSHSRLMTPLVSIIALIAVLHAFSILWNINSAIVNATQIASQTDQLYRRNNNTLTRHYVDCDREVLNSDNAEHIALQPASCRERVRKGQAHICRMKAAQGPSFGSKYDKSVQVAEYGWDSAAKASPGGAVEVLRRASPGIAEILAGIDIHTEEELWKSLDQEHAHNTPQRASDENAKHRASGGTFTNLINLSEGVVIAQNNYGPPAMYQQMKE